MPDTLDLVDLVRRLREAGFRTDTRQYLIANELLLALARQGSLLTSSADPRNGERLVTHLAPIFCTSPEEQSRFREVVRDWLGAPTPMPSMRRGTAPGFVPSLRRILGLTAAPLAAAALLIAVIAAPLWYLFATVDLQGEVVRVVAQADGTTRTVPAPKAQLTYLGASIPVVADGRFTLRVRRHSAGSSLVAKLDKQQNTVDVDPRSMQSITIRFEAPEAAPPPKPAQRYQLGAVRILRPPQPAPRVAEKHDWPAVVLIAGIIGATAFGLMALAARRRKQLVLKRMPVEGRADVRTLAMERAAMAPLPGPYLRGLVRGLRRPRLDEARDLSVARSVDATVNAAGLFTPVYLPRRRTPEYLVLSGNRSADDHQAHLVDALLDQLGPAGVSIEHYTFEEDPRMCRRARDPLRQFSLGELAATHHPFTLWIVAEARSLVDPLAGEPAAWTSTLSEWSNRVLFTPAPVAHWTRHEWALAATGLTVLPWSAAGIRTYADLAGEWRIEQLFPAPYARAFPSLIVGEGREWLSPSVPPPETAAKLLRQLRGYLGPDGFAWLCACAIYPQLSVPLTRHLADAVNGARPSEALVEDVLPSLARLPWFRYGTLPDWLRLALVAQLAPEQEASLRARLNDLLGQLAVQASTAATGPAAEGLRVATPAAARDIIATEPPNSPLRDAVFLGFMGQANLDKLAVHAPEALRNLLRRAPTMPVFGTNPQPRKPWWVRLRENASWLLTFRPVLVRGATALLIGAGAFGATAAFMTSTEPVPVPPQQIRSLAITLDGAELAIGTNTGSVMTWNIAAADVPPESWSIDQSVEALALHARFANAPRTDLKAAGIEAVAAAEIGQRQVSIAAGGSGNTVLVRDLVAPSTPATSLSGHTAAITTIAYSPDGRQVLTGSEDRTARLWDAASGTQVHRLDGHTGGIRTVGFSPDGARIFTGSDDGTTRIWDAATGRTMLRLDGPADGVVAAKSSADGRRLFTVSRNLLVRIWDAGAGKLTRQFRLGPGTTARVAFMPGDDVIAAALATGGLRVIDLRSGRVLEPLIATPAEVIALAFSANGYLVAATTESIRIWPFELKQAAAAKEALPPTADIPPARSVVVPNVVGLGLFTALDRLAKVDLKGSQIDQTSATPSMVVTQQTPAAGRRVAPGATVQLRLGLKEVRVPNVIGMSLDRARKELQGLSLGASAPRTAPGSARVVDQRPGEGSILGTSSVVTLQVDLPQEAGNAPPKDSASTGWCCVLQSGYGAQQQQQQVQRTGGGEVIEMDEKQCAGLGGTFWPQQSQAIAACRPPSAPAAPAAPGNLRVQ